MNPEGLVYRSLTRADVPQIVDISKDIWEGEDYIPLVIDHWLNDSKNYSFGIFSAIGGERPNKLLAFARVVFLSPGRVWFEGGRVRESYQKQGLGKFLMRHSLEYAASHQKVEFFEYSTYSENEGSIALAKSNGFQQIGYLSFLFLEPSHFTALPSDTLPGLVEPLSADQAFSMFQSHLPGLSHINLGWHFIPADGPLFLKHGSAFDWYRHHSAIMRVETPQMETGHEGTAEEQIACTLYGPPEDAVEIIAWLIERTKLDEKIEEITVFVQPEIAPHLLARGFTHEKDHESGILLFQKEVRQDTR